MTSKQVYLGVLVDINKSSSPSFLLEDFNYTVNKAISQTINERYNIYDINQQTSDDLRVLKSTAVLVPHLATDTYSISENFFSGIYEVNLPLDYLHLLNCICNYKNTKKCYNNYRQIPAKRLTGDMWSQVVNNYYNRPSSTNPYYYINNVNKEIEISTNKSTGTNLFTSNGTDEALPRKISINGSEKSLVDKDATIRYGNASPIRLEIRIGKIDDNLDLKEIFIDYIKTPQFIELTYDQIETTIDTSQIMEFPDYMCQEIINKTVKLILERESDPRLQTNLAVNQTITNPQQTKK